MKLVQQIKHVSGCANCPCVNADDGYPWTCNLDGRGGADEYITGVDGEVPPAAAPRWCPLRAAPMRLTLYESEVQPVSPKAETKPGPITEADLLATGERLHDVVAARIEARAKLDAARTELSQFRRGATSDEPLPREQNVANFRDLCKFERKVKQAQIAVATLEQEEADLWAIAARYAEQE